MIWHDVRDPNDPELDTLAERYHLHPLLVEDCRHRNQHAKVETGNGYVFVVSKPAHINVAGKVDMDFFLRPDFLITVQGGICPDLFKKPWTLSGKVEFMFGVDPEWIHTRRHGVTTNALGGEVDLMFWPSSKRRLG